MTAPPAQARRTALDWLLAACRAQLAPHRMTVPVPAPEPPVDWHALDHLAYLHNLQPLFHRLAGDGRIAVADVPDWVRTRWEETYHLNYVFNAGLLESVGDILDGCAARELPVVMFKGLVTASRVYDDLAARVQGDVDLLCREADLPPLGRLVRAAGYRPVAETALYHLEFYNGDLRAGLELHFAIYDFVDNRTPLLARLLDHPAIVQLEGRSIPAPPLEVDLLLDLAHLLNHDLEVPLRSLLEFAAKTAALERAPGRDRWEAVLREADLTDEFWAVHRIVSDLFSDRQDAAEGSPSAGAGVVEARTAFLREYLENPEGFGTRRLLADTALRGSLLRRGQAAWRLIVPKLSHLQALHGSTTAAGALCSLPSHVGRTLRRGLTNLRNRRAPISPLKRASLRRTVYQRRVNR